MEVHIEEKMTTLGKSILVPSVQEIAKECLEKVPDRYIQVISANQEDYGLNDCDINVNDDIQVPIIDMEALIAGDGLELDKLHSACQDWGFFQIVNHGIDNTLVEKFKMETKELFDLPIEEKKKYWQTSNEVEGFGQAFVVSDDQKLDWADIFFVNVLPKYMRKPNLIPMLPLPYRNTLELYSEKIQKLGINIIDCMSKALKIKIEVMRRIFGNDGLQSFRMNYYPPCPQPDKVIGLTPHSDAAGLTILLQFDDIEGLQIRKNHKWVTINPLPNAFVVNVGDILEIVTNGIYRSILHRSVVNATKARISVAAFYSPSMEGTIGPIPDLIKPGVPVKFRHISVADYFKGLFNRALDGKSYIDVMRINPNDSN
ncbi:unnamed protein product [Amaranthus hypochondriacus]